MPPKAKFTREEVIAAAVEIVREQGIESVTARELGARLNSSARPIFTLFRSMEEVLSEVKIAVRTVYNGYVRQGLSENPAFRGVGKAYIRFAAEEPAMFRLLFMGKNGAGVAEILSEIDENYALILQSITDGYAVSEEFARSLYRHLWIYSHGIATLCATSSCSFSAEEIGGMLTEVFRALLMQRGTGVIK